VQADLQAGAGDSVRHRAGEISGYGSRARWAHRGKQRGRPISAAGARRELARYEPPDGTRAVVAQRIDGRVAISDVPLTSEAGRVALIERHVTSRAELAGLGAAYVAHSQRAGCPAVVAQRRQLDEPGDVVA
jgi:hypothetical protein